ncbi:MAG: hypothetical protein JWO08_4557 [Verrucomicrobiaceae bacterium]|nr:hypothetical protein [Verrucomicrobiaceae bacterium]
MPQAPDPLKEPKPVSEAQKVFFEGRRQQLKKQGLATLKKARALQATMKPLR